MNWTFRPKIRQHYRTGCLSGSFKIKGSLDRYMEFDVDEAAELDEIPEPTILPGQFSRYSEIDFESKTDEERIAWRLLTRNLLDCSDGDKNARLRSIAEMESWMNDDASKAGVNPGEEGFEYTFDYWAEMLGQEPGYMRRKMVEWLERRREEIV